jgi:hypothetical protein
VSGVLVPGNLSREALVRVRNSDPTVSALATNYR